MDAALQLLGSLLAGVIGAGALLGLAPAKLIDRLFGHYLDRRLADQKHAQEAEIAELQARLTHLADRGVRSNQREFAALEAVWLTYVEAFDAAVRCVVRFIEHPNLDAMSSEDVESYLAEDEWPARSRERVLSSKTRNREYVRLLELKYLNDAGAAIYKARLTLGQQAIYLPEDLRTFIREAIQMLHEAQVERRLQWSGASAPGMKGERRLMKEGEAMQGEMISRLRARMKVVDSLQPAPS